MKLTVKQITKTFNDVLKFCKRPKTIAEIAEAFGITKNCANLRMINFYATGLVERHENKYRWTGSLYQYQNRVYRRLND